MKSLMLLILTIAFLFCRAQNLQSTLLNKNINATFSILAYDNVNKEWGIAVATNNIYVGNSTVYIRPGVGAFSVIAETEPAYAYNGFEQLEKGSSIMDAVEFTKRKDNEWYNRQVSGIDANGNVYSFTGSALNYWQGMAGSISEDGFVVMGNQLADSVLTKMKETYRKATETLAERLLKSLIAGQNAGGQLTGKQSAALVVKGTNNEWYSQIDLRVDNSKTPFTDLKRLLDYHYGRIQLNQAVFALKNGNKKQGEELLRKAEKLLEGWDGMYTTIAMAYILSGEEKKTVAIIQKAISENAQWKENLPAFYCLQNHAEIKALLSESSFSVKNWYSAIQFMLQVNKNKEAIELFSKLVKKYSSSSFLFYLLGYAYLQVGDKKSAAKNLSIAVTLDASNVEAKNLLQQLDNGK